MERDFITIEGNLDSPELSDGFLVRRMYDMKWYFGINEAATTGMLGNEARMAVVSARNHTMMSPHLLYYRSRNDFTDWMEHQGVTIHDVRPALADVIYQMEAQGCYSSAFMGHWLRAEICQIEKDDEFVLYTDCDVIFAKSFTFDKPSLIACAPEFKRDNWNYFNSGVMIINVPALALDYNEFINFAAHRLRTANPPGNDQYAYNLFYRRRWSRLDLNLNWKAYWPPNPNLGILHFHGPKIGVIENILNRNWNWNTRHGVEIGSLLAGHSDNYRAALLQTHNALAGSDERKTIERVLAVLDTKFDSLPFEKVDLNFMNFRLFHDD
jgi:hypothetical protein